MKKIFGLISICFFLALTVFPGTIKAGNGQIMFVAKLNTDNEIPKVRGDALGLVTFMVTEDRKEVLIHGVFTNLTGTTTGCHIHIGNDTSNGPVLVDLTSYISGNRLKATLPLSAGFIQLAQSGQLYLNVHSSAHPDGEMRGQLVMKNEYIIPVFANALSLVPSDTSNKSFAMGTFRFSQNLTRVEYRIMTHGLSGPVTSAEIRAAAHDMNGPLIASMNVGELIIGTIVDTSIVKSIFNQLNLGLAYVVIGTAANTNGEIRANLSFRNDISSDALLSGDQEVPPVNTAATAYGYSYLNATFDSISYLLVYSGITPSAAHIHKATLGVPGPVIIGLDSLLPGLYSGKAAISEDDFTSFLKDELYFNIHSANNPAGEIRGQFENNIMNSFAFDLCSDQENPKKILNAYGASYVAINKTNNELDYAIIVSDLNGDATSTRLYDAAFGSNGNTLINLDLPNVYVSKVIPVTASIVSKINADHTYINVNTAANPSGEARGQVRRVLSCKINTANQDLHTADMSLIQNVITNTLLLKTDSDRNLDSDLIITDMTGNHLFQKHVVISAGIHYSNYDVSSLASGYYLLNIIKNNKSMKVFSFVKI